MQEAADEHRQNQENERTLKQESRSCVWRQHRRDYQRRDYYHSYQSSQWSFEIEPWFILRPRGERTLGPGAERVHGRERSGEFIPMTRHADLFPAPIAGPFGVDNLIVHSYNNSMPRRSEP